MRPATLNSPVLLRPGGRLSLSAGQAAGRLAEKSQSGDRALPSRRTTDVAARRAGVLAFTDFSMTVVLVTVVSL